MPKQNLFFSIIMNCYNGEKYLQEAIDSVISQSFKDWELIFYDNCSIDQSLQIASSYCDKRIKIVSAPNHTELGTARLRAIENATGKWLAFLDVDDLWLSEKLEKQHQLIRESESNGKNLGIIYGKAQVFTSEGRGRIHPVNVPSGKILQSLLQFNFINSTNVAVLKSAYDAVGGFPEGYYSATDYFLSCAVSKYYDAAGIDEVISKYRLHEENTTRYVFFEQKLEVIDILEMYLDESPELWKNIINIKLFLVRAYLKRIVIQSHLGSLLWYQLQKQFRKLFPL